MLIITFGDVYMTEKNNSSENLDLLIKGFLTVENAQECADFLDDLCTTTELKAISQRIAVAKMLLDNCVYSDIVKTTGASTATVSRVKRSLSMGKGSYAVLFKRMEENE